MIKYYCDLCGEQKESINRVEIPYHIWTMKNYKLSSYVDNDFNVVSGRMDEVHMCNSCLNIFYTKGLSEFEVWLSK